MRPTLKILIGPPGCGKSTYARNKHNALVISSDKIRFELFGDESCQEDNNKVFELMRSRAHQALLEGKNVILDATNMTRKDRAAAISCRTKECSVQAIVIFNSIDKCIANDLERDRTVGADVIMKMLKRFQFPYFDEGFDEIKIVGSCDNSIFDVHELAKNYVMSGTDISQDNPHHSFTIREHCDRAFKYAIEHEMSPFVRMAAEIHDCGKPETKVFEDSKGNKTDIAHYYGHMGVSAWKAIKCTSDPFVLWLISNHMEPFFNSKYYNNLSPWMKKELDNLHEADLAAK